MSITRDEVLRALYIAEELSAHGFSVHVAGGFCRDVYFGEAPKDIDIVVSQKSIHDDPAEAYEMLGEILTRLGVTHLGFRKYGEGSSDRLIGAYKCTGNLDVVLYETRWAHEAVDSFDFNLNQFVLQRRDNFEEAYVVYAGDTSYHELTPVREDYSAAREAKMRAKFIDLVSRYPEGQGPVRVGLAQAFPKEV